MTIKNLDLSQRERTGLGITAEDLNESDDPLDNILLDVMFESFYEQIAKKRSIPKE
jgi:hypothetical protein